MTVFWNTSGKKCILWVSVVIISAPRTCNLFFQWLISGIDNNHINGLHLFWDSFVWFCQQISCGAKYFPLLSKASWSMISSCYSILFSNLKQKNNIIRRFISNQMGPMYIKIPYTCFVPDHFVSKILKHPIFWKMYVFENLITQVAKAKDTFFEVLLFSRGDTECILSTTDRTSWNHHLT